ncbi:MAG: glycosyltransferase family 39 protein, partial [Candidatus Omnitrophota bacterium]
MDLEKAYKWIKKHISVILICAVVFAFAARIGSFEKKHPLTFDESVYAILAAQIGADPADYNTVRIYRDAREKGRELPAYFNKPLFKHPPLFARMISSSYRVFGSTYYSAFKVSLFSGILLIILAYLLGEVLFDNKTGAWAAAIMAIEPVTWITSQKIWMETALAFFMVLALYLFATGLKKQKPYFFLASGIAAGLAALVKYPGVLVTAVICLYALSCERRLFKTRFFV